MSSSPTWLTTLKRVREHRHDAAMQLLAQRLKVAAKVRDAAASVEASLSHLGQVQQRSGLAGRLDSERLQQLRLERDSLCSQRTDLSTQQSSANAAVRQAQSHAAAKDAEAEVLRRLQDRLDSTHRQAQRRRDEQTPLEATLSLCNGGLSG